MNAIVEVENLRKVYEGGFEALKGVDLSIRDGEILALLGPNGAGKTTLISVVCGIVTPTSGSVRVGGHDIMADYRAARSMIGLVPQEVALEPFETVMSTVRLTRGLFGKKRDDAYIEKVLTSLSLWDKRDTPTKALSGGMKRRVLIAKALSHEPRVIFLDEPTAGVDVELRKGMWDIVRQLQADGATIILTTHYIEEAEAMADRVGVINDGRILLVEDKDALLKEMGRKELTLTLATPLASLPPALSGHDLALTGDGCRLVYPFDSTAGRTGITQLLNDLAAAGLTVTDIDTRQSSLEEIFVGLVKETA
ncbi:multidrug ABC transporter ATP-binding protein [Zhengella mangrovi]|uniref:Multidrug ABC transporter ATP-binding protein n=1 Tax=Zhengella mangrovi TaxID=1982044 RepID=A0A2G1QNF0_9HYPH|nr:ABC transporter ATP-binding protein [Zhengella mangrovi]PHP67053.1 multidrug ABC transporter ATP-binding protein [Zhengella mangrovi]